jgi:hypothetical protein
MQIVLIKNPGHTFGIVTNRILRDKISKPRMKLCYFYYDFYIGAEIKKTRHDQVSSMCPQFLICQ